MSTYKHNSVWKVKIILLVVSLAIIAFMVLLNVDLQKPITLNLGVTYSDSELRTLDNKKVIVYGFTNQRTMAATGDGYFSSTPLSTSVMLWSSGEVLTDVYFKVDNVTNTSYQNAAPLILTGTFKYQEVTDSYGNVFPFYVDNCRFKEYEISDEDSYELRRYVELFDNGFMNRFESILNEILVYIESDKKIDVELFSEDDLTLVKDYPEVLSVCVSLQDIVNYYNENESVSNDCIEYIEQLYVDFLSMYCNQVTFVTEGE